MEIDERVNAFLSRLLERGWPGHRLNAPYVKVRDGRCIVSRAVIVAGAVNEDERREEVGIAAGLSEAETFSNDFLRFLDDRGLHATKLVIVEDYKGF